MRTNDLSVLMLNGVTVPEIESLLQSPAWPAEKVCFLTCFTYYVFFYLYVDFEK